MGEGGEEKKNRSSVVLVMISRFKVKQCLIELG